MDPLETIDCERDDYQRSHEIRMAATIGFFKADATHRLQVLARARPRTQWRPSQGGWAMLHRNNVLRRWHAGPGSVIQVSGTSCWIVNKTSLLRGSAADVRNAPNDEKDGVELIERYLLTLGQELLQRRRRREYWDLTHTSSRSLRMMVTGTSVHLGHALRLRNRRKHLRRFGR